MKLRVSLALFALLSLASGLAHAQMSESEKKAAARASFLEGVELQEKGKPLDALARFEAAQKLFDAPTHLLRIAECQAITGKLVEAAETYETLARKQLPPGSPEAFVQAQEQGKVEAASVRARIPTLKVTVQPEPSKLRDLRIFVDDRPIPAELVGIARPVNPGSYRVTASAAGHGVPAPVAVELGEKESKTADLVLQPGVTTPPPVAADAPAAEAPPPYEAKAAPKPSGGPSSTGFLLGLRPMLLVPVGDVRENVKFSDYASAGPGLGLDAIMRVAKIVLVGGTLEFGSLGAPDDRLIAQGTTADVTTSTFYAGLLAGIMPNVNRFTFVADVGLGYRSLSRDLALTGAQTARLEEEFSGVDFTVHAGFSIPAGPLRVVPKVGLSAGDFGDRSCGSGGAVTSGLFSGCSESVFSSSTHVFLSAAVGVYWHIDLKKAGGGLSGGLRRTANAPL